MSVLTVNGVTVATPNSLQVIISDLDGESNRNAKGLLLRDRIAVKRTVSCGWPPLSMTDVSNLLTAMSGVFFPVTYPDPMDGAMATRTFYVGDRTAPVYRLQEDGTYLWESMKADFIEQ